MFKFFFFSSRRRHTRSLCDWSSDVCSSDLRPDHSQIHRSTSGWIMELGARMGIGPGGFEPPYPDPKSGVLPLDEGPARLWRLNLQSQAFRWKAQTFPLLSR